ncbi:hypothetical protein GS930_08605 [Rhodococcus hoagii]|nr:hypothetical protein [Prescottella equi]
MIGLGELESAVMGLANRVSDAGVLLVLVVLLFVGVAGRMLRRRRTASREAVPAVQTTPELPWSCVPGTRPIRRTP